MKKILLTFLLLCIVTLTSVYAQSRKITGSVESSDDGQPLAGVSIAIVGTSIGTQSSANGSFSLTVPAGAKAIRFTYLGFKATSVPLTSSSVYTVKLVPESSTLNEVVVTSYGTVQTKRESGGAISTSAQKSLRTSL